MNRINRAQFNEDCSCFAVAHSRGFKVYSADPLDQWVSRDFGAGAALGAAAVLDRTNYVALVGGGGARFPAERLVLWNDQAQESTSVELGAPLLAALVDRRVLVGVAADAVHVAALAPPHAPLARFATFRNERGVAALHNGTLVVPGRTRGQVAVIDCAKAQTVEIIPCHRSEIAAIAVSDRHIATASATGTLIRVHDRASGTARWFRRGLDRASVFSLALSPRSDRLAVLSDKRTLHVFALGDSGPAAGAGTDKHRGGGGSGGGDEGDDSAAGAADSRGAAGAGSGRSPHADNGAASAAGAGATNEKHPLADVPFAPKRYFRDVWSSARVKTRSKEPGVCGWTSDDAVVVLRPQQAQWEKYVVQGADLLPEGWRAIR